MLLLFLIYKKRTIKECTILKTKLRLDKAVTQQFIEKKFFIVEPLSETNVSFMVKIINFENIKE